MKQESVIGYIIFTSHKSMVMSILFTLSWSDPGSNVKSSWTSINLSSIP